MSTYTIAGGGIAGASIGYHLAKAGHTVTLYDRGDTGQATAASAGIIAPWISQKRNKKWYRLVTAGARYYPEFVETIEAETGVSTGYKRKGALCLFKDDEVLEKGFKRIYSKKDDAPEMGDVYKVPREEVKKMHPHLTDLYPGVYVEGGGQIEGANLLKALKAGFLHYGGQWVNGDFDPAKTEGLLIYASGAWAIEQGYQPEIRHQRSEVFHFEVKEPLKTSDTPVVMALGPIYLVELGGNKYAIGTTHTETKSFSTEPSQENYEYLKALAQRYFPDSEIEDINMMVGLKPFARDYMPYIGFAEENVFVVNGLGSTGLTASPVLGREVSKFLNGIETELNFEDYSYI